MNNEVKSQVVNKEVKKDRQAIIYEFEDEQSDLIIECYDDKLKRAADNSIVDYMAVNVDPTNKLISAIKCVDGQITILNELGGANVPTLMKLLNMLDITVTCQPLKHNFSQKQRGESYEKSEIKETKEIK